MLFNPNCPLLFNPQPYNVPSDIKISVCVCLPLIRIGVLFSGIEVTCVKPPLLVVLSFIPRLPLIP